MSVEPSNQAGRIIAEAIIESAALYSETLKEASRQLESALAALHRQFYAEKQRCEEEIARLQQAVKDQEPKPEPKQSSFGKSSAARYSSAGKSSGTQSNKSSGTSANKSSGTSSGKSDKNIYDVIVGGKNLLE